MCWRIKAEKNLLVWHENICLWSVIGCLQMYYSPEFIWEDGYLSLIYANANTHLSLDHIKTGTWEPDFAKAKNNMKLKRKREVDKAAILESGAQARDHMM